MDNMWATEVGGFPWQRENKNNNNDDDDDDNADNDDGDDDADNKRKALFNFIVFGNEASRER